MYSSHKPNSFMRLLEQAYYRNKQDHSKNTQDPKQTESDISIKPVQKQKLTAKTKNKEKNNIIQSIKQKQSEQNQADPKILDKLSDINHEKCSLNVRKRNKSQQKIKSKDLAIQQITAEPVIQSLVSQQSQSDDQNKPLINEKNESDLQSSSIMEVDKKTFEQSQKNQFRILQIQQLSADEWIPSQKQSILLSIQKMIDEFLIRKLKNIGNERIQLSQLIAYIRDQQGFAFNFSILLCILKINPQLYQLTSTSKCKYISCARLDYRAVEKRQRITQQLMRNAQ